MSSLLTDVTKYSSMIIHCDDEHILTTGFQIVTQSKTEYFFTHFFFYYMYNVYIGY